MCARFRLGWLLPGPVFVEGVRCVTPGCKRLDGRGVGGGGQTGCEGDGEGGEKRTSRLRKSQGWFGLPVWQANGVAGVGGFCVGAARYWTGGADGVGVLIGGGILKLATGSERLQAEASLACQTTVPTTKFFSRCWIRMIREAVPRHPGFRGPTKTVPSPPSHVWNPCVKSKSLS